MGLTPTEIFLVTYFSLVNGISILLLLSGCIVVYQRLKDLKSEIIPIPSTEITFIVPAYNERYAIFTSIASLLSLDYPHKRVIIVNDGSSDAMLPFLQEILQLDSLPKFYSDPLPTAHIRGIYQSNAYPEVIVLDKEHKGKFDAINAGINACQSPFFVINDADTTIDSKAFDKVVRAFLKQTEPIAMGAAIRIRRFQKGFLTIFQELEYLKCFLTRLGWNCVNGCFVISGAFSLFAKKAVIDVGGFSPCVAEDMEIIVKLQRHAKTNRLKHKIFYLPDPVSETDGPDTLSSLGKQRVRWHFGLLETLWNYKSLFFNHRFGFFGLIIYPFWFFCEAIEPLIEIFGFLYILTSWALGSFNLHLTLLVIALTIGFNLLLILICLITEEFSFKKYNSWKSLLFYSLFEIFGYRQFTLLCRFASFYRLLTK